MMKTRHFQTKAAETVINHNNDQKRPTPTMVLPVAVGVKSCSSCTQVSPPDVIEREEDELLYRRLPTVREGIAMASSDDHILSATVFVTIYGLTGGANGNDGLSAPGNCIGNLRSTRGSGGKNVPSTDTSPLLAYVTVQVSGLAQHFSSSTRATVHKVPLPSTSLSSLTEAPNASTHAVFAPNNRHLLLRIGETLVVFQLRKPRQLASSLLSSTRSPLPLPSYIQSSNDNDNVQSNTSSGAPNNMAHPAVTNSSAAGASFSTNANKKKSTDPSLVATNPRVVQHQTVDDATNNEPADPAFRITALCPVHNGLVDTLWLLADTNGDIWVLSSGWRLSGPIYQTQTSVVSMQHHTSSNGRGGRLVLLDRDGHAAIFASKWTTDYQEYILVQKNDPEEERGEHEGNVDEDDDDDDSDYDDDDDEEEEEGDDEDNDDFDDDDEEDEEEQDDSDEDNDDLSENNKTIQPMQSTKPSGPRRSSSIMSIETKATTTTLASSGLSSRSTNDPPSVFYLILSLESTRTTTTTRLLDCVWVADNLIAFLRSPSKSSVVADVWNCVRQQLVTELRMERLEDVAHGTITTQTGAEGAHFGEDDDLEREIEIPTGSSYGIQYDAVCNSLAILSHKDPPIGDDGTGRQSHGFSCVWNWRTNVLGLTLQHNGPENIPAAFCFAQDGKDRRSLVHIQSSGRRTVRKHCLPVGLLSPPETRFHPGCCDESSNLLLCEKSVRFPVYCKVRTG